jgi:hypothetical protein
MKSIAVLAAAFVVSSISVSDAQVTQSGGGYLLRMKHVAGKTYSYSTTLETSGASVPKGKVTQELPFRWEVQKVEKGVATIRMTIEKTGGPGNQISVPVVMDAQGKAVNKTSGKGLQRLGPVFPTGPVKVGAKFTTTDKTISMNLGEFTATDVYTFTGLKTVDGRKVAGFSVSSKIDGKRTKGGGGGTMLIDAADGYLYRRDFVMNLTATINGKTETIVQKVSSVRR